MSWNEVQTYVAWLKKKTGKEYRLLTEAEREYATRAGTRTPFWWGAAIAPDQANYGAAFAPENELRETLPVKSFQPNPSGLYQVHGNVWEWVEDCWREDYSGAPDDGSAWTAGACEARIVRGGSFVLDPQSLRAARRDRRVPSFRDLDAGFRVARTL